MNILCRLNASTTFSISLLLFLFVLLLLLLLLLGEGSSLPEGELGRLSSLAMVLGEMLRE